ncbi:MAG: CidA/LrgA family protein [Reinekea sp.]
MKTGATAMLCVKRRSIKTRQVGIVFGIFVLIAFWFAGSALAGWLHWPIPGSVVGLLGLWLVLVINGGVPDWLKQPSNLLLRYLTLLFVPAGVGLINHWALLTHYGVHIVIIIAVSTVLPAIVMIAIFKLMRTSHDK